MDKTALIIKGVVTLVIALGIFIYLMWRSLKRSEEPVKLIAKWIMTGIVFYGLISQAVPLVLSGSAVAALAVPLAAVYGLVLALIWTPSIVDYFSKKFEALYTGGDEPPVPKPSYAEAIARRIAGKYQEAIYLVHEQLDKFPNDFAGQMLIAEIQATGMKDLPAAEVTIRHICQQPEHPPAAVALALNALADWHLSVGKDADSARAVLEEIGARFPDSEQSLQAAQRLAHLASQAHLLEPQERKPIKLPPGRRDLGLRRVDPSEIIPTVSKEEKLEQLLAQLDLHPLDLDAREKLAVLYAEEFQRLDAAVNQLEQLIACPHVAPKQLAHWLNAVADYHLRLANDRPAATAALQRIVELLPNTAHALQAQDRLIELAGEAKPRTAATPIKLGTYEQYLGLKMKKK